MKWVNGLKEVYKTIWKMRIIRKQNIFIVYAQSLDNLEFLRKIKKIILFLQCFCYWKYKAKLLVTWETL